MFPPIIPLLSAACAALGIYGLYWYERLSKVEQEEANRLACEYALRLYNKALDQLTKQQLAKVEALVKNHFV